MPDSRVSLATGRVRPTSDLEGYNLRGALRSAPFSAQVKAVPEPSTIGLFGVGCLGCYFVRRAFVPAKKRTA